MNIEKDKNGNLLMTADCNEQQELQDWLAIDDGTTPIIKESQFISDSLINPMGDNIDYEQVMPEEIGALTNAPIITDGTNVWGYMDYQIKNFLEELAKGETIFWLKG